MLHDTLKDNWTYQQMLAEGIEQGHIDEARQNIESFLERRFPMLLVGVKEQIEQITDLKILREFLLTVGMAQTEDEVKQSLFALQ